MTIVLAPAGDYRAAVAELPLRTRLGDRAAGAIVVVAGSADWVDAAIAAAAGGAAAVVVADPEFVPAAEVGRLARAVDIPVIVERPLLRHDVAGDALTARAGAPGTAAPRALVVDAAASRARVPAVARDAIGWLRVLAQGELSIVAVDGTFGLFETRAGVPATMTVVANRRPGAGRVHARALGEVITEVEVEGRLARVVTATIAGRLIAPARFESSERFAVRRALDALTGGEGPDDLAELTGDTEFVERMLRSAP